MNAQSVNARTGERRRAATQQDLLDATTRLLEGGAPLASLSIEKIVREAGVVRTTFYLHFSGKHELVEQLAAEQVAWFASTGLGARSDPELTRETVRRTVDEIVAMWARHQAVISAIIELAEYDDRMRATWGTAMRDVAARASDVFRAHWATTGLTPEDPGRVAEALTWMIERCCHQVLRDPDAHESISASMAEIIWRTLHPQPSPAEPPPPSTERPAP